MPLRLTFQVAFYYVGHPIWLEELQAAHNEVAIYDAQIFSAVVCLLFLVRFFIRAARHAGHKCIMTSPV